MRRTSNGHTRSTRRATVQDSRRTIPMRRPPACVWAVANEAPEAADRWQQINRENEAARGHEEAD